MKKIFEEVGEREREMHNGVGEANRKMNEGPQV